MNTQVCPMCGKKLKYLFRMNCYVKSGSGCPHCGTTLCMKYRLPNLFWGILFVVYGLLVFTIFQIHNFYAYLLVLFVIIQLTIFPWMAISFGIYDIAKEEKKQDILD